MLKLDISVVSSKINFSATKGSKKIKILERNEFGEIQVCLFGGLTRGQKEKRNQKGKQKGKGVGKKERKQARKRVCACVSLREGIFERCIERLLTEEEEKVVGCASGGVKTKP